MVKNVLQCSKNSTALYWRVPSIDDMYVVILDRLIMTGQKTAKTGNSGD